VSSHVEHYFDFYTIDYTRVRMRGLFVARVKLMTGNFTDASTTDEKLRDIKLVFITALCSKSGVANPVSFVVTEGEGNQSVTVKAQLHTDQLVSNASLTLRTCTCSHVRARARAFSVIR